MTHWVCVFKDRQCVTDTCTCTFNGMMFLGDTASNLGSAMDELMRHQPLLKSSVMKALVRVREKQKQ